jgi:hypothetical protein
VKMKEPREHTPKQTFCAASIVFVQRGVFVQGPDLALPKNVFRMTACLFIRSLAQQFLQVESGRDLMLPMAKAFASYTLITGHLYFDGSAGIGVNRGRLIVGNPSGRDANKEG